MRGSSGGAKPTANTIATAPSLLRSRNWSDIWSAAIPCKSGISWVPFAGGQEAALALLGCHIDVAVMTPSSALAQVNSGDIRLLGISSAPRDRYFPDVPTFKEQGYDVVASIWRGVMVKAGTPQPIIDTLTSALDKIKQTDEWQKFSRLNMQSPVDISLADMQTRVRQEVRDDREFLEASGLRK